MDDQQPPNRGHVYETRNTHRLLQDLMRTDTSDSSTASTPKALVEEEDDDDDEI